MDAEYKDMNESAPIPSLTLEPELENTPKLVVAEETKLQQPKVAEPVLTPQEQQMVNDFAQKIDVENTAQICSTARAPRRRWPTSPTLPSPMCAHRTWARWARRFQTSLSRSRASARRRRRALPAFSTSRRISSS